MDTFNENDIKNDLSSDDIDASNVLAEALQQMDGIIAGIDSDLTEITNKSINKVSTLLSELGDILKLWELNNNNNNNNNINDEKLLISTIKNNTHKSLINVDQETVNRIIHWLTVNTSLNENNLITTKSAEQKVLEERAMMLEKEKEDFQSQFQVMQEAMIQKDEYISNLQEAINDLKSQLHSSENLLEEMMANRVKIEKENSNLIKELNQMKANLNSNKIIVTNGDHNENHNHTDNNNVITGSKENKENISMNMNEEMIFMKKKLIEKETEISTLRLALAKFLRNSGFPITDSELCLLKGRSLSFESLMKRRLAQENKVNEKPPVPPRITINASGEVVRRSSVDSASNTGRPAIPAAFVRGRSMSPTHSQMNGNGYQTPRPVITPPVAAITGTAAPFRHYNTMPRLYGAKIATQINNEVDKESANTNNNHNPVMPYELYTQKAIINKQNSTDRNRINPDDPLAIMQQSNPDLGNSILIDNGDITLSPSMKPKGFKKILEKMKRSNSSTNQNFNRGGFRATTGSRLNYSTVLRRKFDSNSPISKWDVNMICDWLTIIGLGMYMNNVRDFVKNGEHLIKLNDGELEKNIGMKSRLHRKKLQLTIKLLRNECDLLSKQANKLDYLYIAKWLDDIGLSQYKENFLNSRIDGLMINNLTIEDLTNLKITSYLHYLSIRRSIEILRKNKFNGNCLIKRYNVMQVTNENNINNVNEEKNSWSIEEISLWTNYRVIDWLRSIDLPEYADNLIESGVNGALIILEPAFNVDLFSTLLGIPTTKTLLRRHLCSQFNKLIGPDLVNIKRNYEAKVGYVALQPATKIKAFRGNQFSIIRRRGKPSLNYDDLVCPKNENDDNEGADSVKDDSVNDFDDEISTKSSIESNV